MTDHDSFTCTPTVFTFSEISGEAEDDDFAEMDFDEFSEDDDEAEEAVAAAAWAGRKQQWLNTFKSWLDALDDLPEEEDEDDAVAPAPDLFAFFGELQALRQDGKLQAKINQGLREQLDALSSTLRTDLGRHGETLDAAGQLFRQQIPQIRKDARREPLSELLRIHEAIGRTVRQAAPEAQPWFLSPARRRQFNRRLQENLALLQANADESLARLKAIPVARVGERFDPVTMRAVEAVSTADPAAADRILDVYRQGYTLDGEVIQTADVKVSRLCKTPT